MNANNMKIPLLSFFTGGGFLDIGFENNGFEVIFSNEIDRDFAQFYKEGMSSLFKVDKEITNTSSFDSITTSEIKKNINSSIFGIIGGPPCQDFSIRGAKNGFNGVRATMTYHFAEKIKAIKPSFFLIENVPGLVLLNNTKEKFNKIIKELGKVYYVAPQKLNALHFGVPQFRERLFVFGIRKDLINSMNIENLFNGGKFDFPWPKAVYPNAESKFLWQEPSNKALNFNDSKITPPKSLCVNNVLINGLEKEKIPNANEYFNLKNLEKTKLIEEGDTYRPSFKKLHRNKFSPTVCYGNNEVHLHPFENRRISVREALRLQGVPDNYIIETNGKLSKKFKMISNGVPVLLAEKIAQSIKKLVNELISSDGYLEQGKTKRSNVKNPVEGYKTGDYSKISIT